MSGSWPPDDGIREVFFRMHEHRVRHLPVVDEAGMLVGLMLSLLWWQNAQVLQLGT